MELFEKVCSVIRKNKGITDEIRPGDRLREDLGLDSFDTLMIGCDLEDELQITIDPDEIRGLEFVRDVMERLAKKIEPVKAA